MLLWKTAPIRDQCPRYGTKFILQIFDEPEKLWKKNCFEIGVWRAIIYVKAKKSYMLGIYGLIQICRIKWWCSGFPILTRNTFFWVNLIQKINIVCLGWNLVARLIRLRRIQWWCSVFSFSTTNTIFGKFYPKTQNYLFKMKFDTYSKVPNKRGPPLNFFEKKIRPPCCY